MPKLDRFQDQNFRLTHFQTEVCVVCPQCAKKASTKVNYETNSTRLFCENCGYNKDKTIESNHFGIKANFKKSANSYFDVSLWYVAPFKNDYIWAYNLEHLTYLENYIAAKQRQSKDRTHFTLLEKLPKFYHEAKNREALLKMIDKLKKK